LVVIRGALNKLKQSINTPIPTINQAISAAPGPVAAAISVEIPKTPLPIDDEITKAVNAKIPNFFCIIVHSNLLNYFR
jgi:hypothetical protein